jgi:type VI secretion system secreted protein VgrG
VRVADTWAGTNFGSIRIPRVGQEVLVEYMESDADEVRGPGVKYQELSAPHIVLASPAGVEMTAGTSAHIAAFRDTAVTSERHCSVSAGGDFLVASMDKVRLFASSLGMRFMAARGKVRVRAHTDALDAIAEKVASIISVGGGIRVSSPKSITLSAGGSYLRISGAGVEHGTGGGFTVHAASHDLLGPRAKEWLAPSLPEVEDELEDPPTLVKIRLSHGPGHPALADEPYRILVDGEELERGLTDKTGLFTWEYDPRYPEFDIEMVNGHRFHIKVVETHAAGEEGWKQRLARDGFRTYIDTDAMPAEEYLVGSWRSLYGRESGE